MILTSKGEKLNINNNWQLLINDKVWFTQTILLIRDMGKYVHEYHYHNLCRSSNNWFGDIYIFLGKYYAAEITIEEFLDYIERKKCIAAINDDLTHHRTKRDAKLKRKRNFKRLKISILRDFRSILK